MDTDDDDEEQFNIIVAHVTKHHPPPLVCPFCGTVDQWSVEPIGVVPDYGPGTLETEPFAPKSGRMYVALGCRNCFFTYHFAWRPMERAAEAAEAAKKATDDMEKANG